MKMSSIIRRLHNDETKRKLYNENEMSIAAQRVIYRTTTGAASNWRDQAFEFQNGDRLRPKTSHDPSLTHPLQFPIPRQTFLSTIYKKCCRKKVVNRFEGTKTWCTIYPPKKPKQPLHNSRRQKHTAEHAPY